MPVGNVTGVGEEPDPVVIADVFPAEVATPSGVHRGVRAVVTRTRLYVWAADGAGRRLVLCEPVDLGRSAFARPGAPRSHAHHLTVSGQQEATMHITRARGCGCGSPLKGWAPWTPYVKGPTA